MFGTMGISELIIILVIVLIIFGAGRLPSIGEGVGKALKGFKKEVNEIPPPPQEVMQPQSEAPATVELAPVERAAAQPAVQPGAAPKATNVPYVAGPELTPGTTASMMYNMGPQSPQAARPASVPPTQPGGGQQALSMEERAATPAPMSRAQYPPLPPGAQAKPAAKRPSAIVNKDAVARVQAQQAALKAKSAQAPAGLSPNDMQGLGEGLGDALRTFRQTVADVRNTVDPQVRTIQSEMDSAQKEFQQSLEAARELPAVEEEPPRQA